MENGAICGATGNNRRKPSCQYTVIGIPARVFPRVSQQDLNAVVSKRTPLLFNISYYLLYR